jgi:hypothetical protein
LSQKYLKKIECLGKLIVLRIVHVVANVEETLKHVGYFGIPSWYKCIFEKLQQKGGRPVVMKFLKISIYLFTVV